jgi:hypothetical protein
MELKDFFGLDFNFKQFEINTLLDLMGMRRLIEKTRQVSQIMEHFGKRSPYVDLAKRQQTLNHFKPLLEQDMLDYDAHHYEKEINTATEHDRRYNAEDRLLEFALIVAAGQTPRQLKSNDFKPDIKALRSVRSSDRFDRLWDVLSREAGDIIKTFKKEIAG